jgi:hypothetical protein
MIGKNGIENRLKAMEKKLRPSLTNNPNIIFIDTYADFIKWGCKASESKGKRVGYSSYFNRHVVPFIRNFIKECEEFEKNEKHKGGCALRTYQD